MKRRVAIVWRVAALIAAWIACADARAAETFAKVSLTPHARVGLASALEPEFTNFHLGFMVFSNVDQRLTNDWQLDRGAVDSARELLKANGFDVIYVTLDAATTAAIRGQDDWSHLNYSGLSREWEKRYGALLTENQLEALVVLREKRVLIGGYGSKYHGYGIFSGRVADLFTTVTADVIGGASPHRSIAECLAVREIDANSEPKDYKELKLEQVAWIRAPLENLIRQKVAFDLGSAGVLPDQSPCPGLDLRKLTR